MAIAISVNNLSKQYRIGAAQTKFRYGMLREQIVDTAKAPFRLAASVFHRNNPQLASPNSDKPKEISPQSAQSPQRISKGFLSDLCGLCGGKILVQKTSISLVSS